MARTEGNGGKEGKQFSRQAFWRKVSFMPRNAGRHVVEKAVTLYVILTDRETPVWARALIVIVLLYFIAPNDAVPDYIPVAGYVDDVAAMTLVLGRLSGRITPRIEARVRRLLPEWISKTPKERKRKQDEQIEHKGEAAGGGEP